MAGQARHDRLFALFLTVFFFCANSALSQETEMYRLQLKDKGNSACSLAHPEAYLSAKSIARREKQGLPVDSFDLPLDPAYLEAIANTGASIQTYSKWVKTVVVQLTDTQIIPLLENLPFVDSVYCVWKGNLPEKSSVKADILSESGIRLRAMNNSYGAGFTQIALNNGQLLHDAGFRGKGMTIAVLDGGFNNADKIDFFNQTQIKEIKSFNYETSDILTESIDHGTRVLSCMLSDKTGEMTGAAPEADYYLFRTEAPSEEFPVEEDYWAAALEYADSLGVDVVTSSLGYFTFDDSTMNHTLSQLDGKTVPISRVANLAASRGILLFNSAGNEGSNSWRKICFPSDAENIITVGSVSKDSLRSYFSSMGYTADHRVKPDLMAMGSNVSVVESSGTIVQSNGTSFSTPIIAGLAACLWEALPDLTSFDMLRLLRETANHFQNPDSLTGYGIADVYKAYLSRQTGLQPPAVSPDTICITFNPFDNRLYINLNDSKLYNGCLLDIYTALGIRIFTVSNLSGSIDISFLPKGVYIVYLRNGDKQWVRKFVKS